MSKHTPEPWHVEQMDGWSVLAYAKNGSQPVVLAGKSAYCDRVKNKENAEANIAHAVACVNALAGLNPEAVGAVVEAAQIISDSHANESITGSVDACRIRAEWLPKLQAALAAMKEANQ